MNLLKVYVSFLCNAPFSRTWLFCRCRPNRCDSTRLSRFLHFRITSRSFPFCTLVNGQNDLS